MTFDDIFSIIIPQKEQTINRFSGAIDLIEKYVRKFPNDANWKRLQEIASDDNWSEMEIVAHTLKGYAGNLGFDTLFQSTSDIVQAIRAKDYESAKIAIEISIKNGKELESYINQLD